MSSSNQRADDKALSTLEGQKKSSTYTWPLSCCTNQHSHPAPPPSPNCLLIQKEAEGGKDRKEAGRDIGKKKEKVGGRKGELEGERDH